MIILKFITWIVSILIILVLMNYVYNYIKMQLLLFKMQRLFKNLSKKSSNEDVKQMFDELYDNTKVVRKEMEVFPKNENQ